MSDELAHDHLPASDRIAEQQQHGAALQFPDYCIMRDQKRDQWHQKHRKA